MCARKLGFERPPGRSRPYPSAINLLACRLFSCAPAGPRTYTRITMYRVQDGFEYVCATARFATDQRESVKVLKVCKKKLKFTFVTACFVRTCYRIRNTPIAIFDCIFSRRSRVSFDDSDASPIRRPTNTVCECNKRQKELSL